jgi:predicted ATPase/DNA-binding SARP family transcriptional activator
MDTREKMVLVRLLGPVDVVGDDGSVRHSGSALRRTLLALLALHPGQVISPDWLMEHVWGDEQPDSGFRALRFHVSQLRKEVGAAVSIETRPGGYRLDVSRDSVDALIFDDHSREARVETDDARAAARCGAALDLWRGAPFGDAAGCPTLDDEAARLEELRLTIIEHSHARRLAAGAGSEVIADLSQLVNEHPLREGLWASLIVAKYRAGHQADALRTYERLRATLAESLGLDPSPELQNLQMRVLRQDPDLFTKRAPATAEERAFSLPTGTVTFLLSDVEGSTRRWEEAPGAMARAVARHYELLDAAIVGHGGVRPVEQGEGDSVVGAFSGASDALAAAVAAQQAFAAEPWREGAELRVRIALHTGEAQLRDRGNYVGPALNRGARIRAIAHGGQVLVSASTAALVADRLPADTTLVDLGLHRLKDLERPEHVWQVVHRDLASKFPPLRSLDMFRHNLPVQLTPLIGRTSEIADVRAPLAHERLVTLTGSAGVGKTRLALAVAAETVDSNPGGVWWVELAPLSDPDAVGRAALAAIGAREAPGATAAHQLAVELGDQRSLLVLDNCEHLIASCAQLVAGLLTSNPSTSVLATSRETLGVPGEITFRVPSLRCPNPERAHEVPTLSQYDATALFVERAQRARPSFTVGEANAPAIAQICHRLDGIPLAIELAAARCGQLSPQRIAAELDDRFRLLTGGARTVIARQQTLAASVDWSHERLDDAEQITFRRLGVFAGSFPLEAAEAVVAAGGDIDRTEVFDLISRLVDKNLVHIDEHPRGELRYRLLETLRAYALDRARTAGELTRIRDAHAAWWADWLEPRGAMPADDILEEIAEFHDNLKAALDWAADQPQLGLRLLRAVSRPWESLGRAGDAMAAADRLLSDDNAHRYPVEWLSAANSSHGLYWLARGPEHTALLERVETLAAQLGDDYHLAQARWHKDPPRSIAAVRDMARDRGDRYLAAEATIALASDLAADEPAAAAPLLLEAQAVAAASGNRDLRDAARMANAEFAAATGDLAGSIELTSSVLTSAPWANWAEGVRVLGFSALLARDELALSLAVEVGNRALRMSPGPAVWTYNARHRLQLLQGHPSVVDPQWRDPSLIPPPTSSGTLWLLGREALDASAPDLAVDRVRASARPVPHTQAVLAAMEAAATGDEDRWHDAITIALDQGLRLIAVDALEGIAVTAAKVRSWAKSLLLLGSAQRLRDETGYQWRFAFEQHSVNAARTSAVDALGSEAEAVETRGHRLDWRAAAAYARRARGERKRPQQG